MQQHRPPAWLLRVDRAIIGWLDRETHRLHRISLGLVFVWFGLLKPFGLKTTSSIVAETI